MLVTLDTRCSGALGTRSSSNREEGRYGIPEECSDAEWEANHTAVLEIAERVVAEL